jgi:serine/threonine protein kinase
MTDPSALVEVLRRWQDAIAQGREPTPQELCPQQPELHRALWLALAALRGVHAVDPDAVSLDPVSPEVAGTVIYRGDRLPAMPGYEILAEIGRSDGTVVYRARQVAAGRDVALKMLVGGNPDRLRAEAEVLAGLDHPNIVHLYEVGASEGQPFLVLEYCPSNLEQRLAGRPLPPLEATELVRTLAAAVQHVHERGLLHRDLAPSHVLLTAEGQPRLTGFGLACKIDFVTGQADAGTIAGTTAYMSPEQVAGAAKLGLAVDVWALGVILYQCLAGRPPLVGPTAMETLMQILRWSPVPLRELAPSVPRDLETICLACLRKEPGRRYVSADELADDLGRFLHGQPIEARPAGALERAWRGARRSPIVAGLALIGGVTLAAGVIALVMHVAGWW